MKKIVLLLCLIFFSQIALADLESAESAYRRKDYDYAFKEFSEYSNRGFPKAHLMLGLMFANGQGVKQDAKTAIEFAQKAIDANYVEAYSLIAAMYASRESGIRDISKAIEWYNKGVKANDTNSMRNLALMYLEGSVVNSDPDQAYLLFKKATDWDDVLSMYELGKMFEFGRGVKQDYAKALNWYQSMLFAPPGKIRLRQPKPRFRIGLIYAYHPRGNNDLYQALKYFEAAAESGISEAMNQAGLMYEGGKGTEKDYHKAALLYEKAANQGNGNAAFNGGRLFEQGIGRDQDLNEALIWFNDAVKLGNTAGMRRIAQYYDSGIVIDKNHHAAKQLYCKSSYLDLKHSQTPYDENVGISIDTDLKVLHVSILSTCKKEELPELEYAERLINAVEASLSIENLQSVKDISKILSSTSNLTTTLSNIRKIDPR